MPAVVVDQPANVVPYHIEVSGDGEHFGAASPSPGLNPADLAAVQQHAVAPAPAAKRPSFSSRFDSHSSLDCFLYGHPLSHRLFPFTRVTQMRVRIAIFVLLKNLPKIIEKK